MFCIFLSIDKDSPRSSDKTRNERVREVSIKEVITYPCANLLVRNPGHCIPTLAVGAPDFLVDVSRLLPLHNPEIDCDIDDCIGTNSVARWPDSTQFAIRRRTRRRIWRKAISYFVSLFFRLKDTTTFPPNRKGEGQTLVSLCIPPMQLTTAESRAFSIPS